MGVEIEFDGKTMICDITKEGDITFANRKFVSMLGYEKEELLGMNISVLKHEDMPLCFFHKMWDAVEKQENWKGYVKIKTKNGDYFWSVMFMTPNENGFSAIFKKAEPKSIVEIQKKYEEALDFEAQGKSSHEIDLANLACEDAVRR